MSHLGEKVNSPHYINKCKAKRMLKYVLHKIAKQEENKNTLPDILNEISADNMTLL